MLWILIRRLTLSLLILFLAAVFVFLATEVLPGDALDVFLTADDLAVMDDEEIEEMRRDFGLDRPAWVRFWDWFSGVLVGNFGKTFIHEVPISEIIWHPLVNSILLGVVITVITLPVALLIGMLTGYRRGYQEDIIVSNAAIVGYSIPDFVIGTCLIIVFAVWMPLFPAVIIAFSDSPPAELLAVSLLPALTVIIGHIAHQSRLLRAGFIETMNSEFVERVRLSGIPESRVIFRHALPASVIPTLNSFAMYTAGVLSGLVVVEKVFGYPGLGRELIEAVSRREVHVVQAITFLSATVVIVMNLLADLAVIILDPRVRSLKS
ncbi:MAG: ABC transporter permease [Chloroflexota bacterium]|nr:ABC transporter permease [Chloroflexota bacterium]